MMATYDFSASGDIVGHESKRGKRPNVIPDLDPLAKRNLKNEV